jgi:hypothetical protein
MPRVLAILMVALTLAGCDVVSKVTDIVKQAHAVEAELEKSTGLRPQVGINLTNGQLKLVTVEFPRIHDTKSLAEVADAVRSAIAREFKLTPENITLSFSLGKGSPGTKA